MELLTSEEFVASFYKNSKNDPNKAFPLAKESWKRKHKAMEKYAKKTLVWGGIISFFVASLSYFIFVSFANGNKNIEIFGSISFAALILIGLFASLIYCMATNPSTLEISSRFPDYKQLEINVPDTFIFALRSWINTKYGYDFSNQNAKEIIQKNYTVHQEKTYKVIYSKDNNSIVGIINNH